MDKKVDDDWGYRWPLWVIRIYDRLYEDFLDGRVSEELIDPSISALGLLEIDPCPAPTINYFKNDVMFTWKSSVDSGYLSIIATRNGKHPRFLAWVSRNGHISRNWEFASVAEIRKTIASFYPSVKFRWNPL